MCPGRPPKTILRLYTYLPLVPLYVRAGANFFVLVFGGEPKNYRVAPVKYQVTLSPGLWIDPTRSTVWDNPPNAQTRRLVDEVGAQRYGIRTSRIND